MKNLSAFSLFETAIVLIIMGIVLSVGLPFFNSLQKTMRYHKTEQNMTYVLKSLGAYTAMHGHLPLPDEGRVPYQALGIDEAMTLDSQRKPFKYDANPALTDNKLYSIDEGERTFCYAKDPAHPEHHDFCAVSLTGDHVTKSVTRNNFVAFFCHKTCLRKREERVADKAPEPPVQKPGQIRIATAPPPRQ